MREKKEINIFIGEQVKKSREEAKFTQEQLAEKIDVSPQYISDLERGVVGISIPTIKKLCLVLCVSSDRILFGNEENNRTRAVTEKFSSFFEKQIFILSEIINKGLSYIKPISNIIIKKLLTFFRKQFFMAI